MVLPSHSPSKPAADDAGVGDASGAAGVEDGAEVGWTSVGTTIVGIAIVGTTMVGMTMVGTTMDGMTTVGTATVETGGGAEELHPISGINEEITAATDNTALLLSFNFPSKG